MTKRKIILLHFLIFLLIGEVRIVRAQTEDSQLETEKSPLSKKELRKLIPKYLGISYGSNFSSFRDFATSPLRYRGSVSHTSFAYIKIGDRRESEFGFSYNIGTYLSDYNDIETTSMVHKIELNYSQLFRVNLINSEKFNTKVGYLLSGNFNIRTNSDLNNNSDGLEGFGNVMGSIKITKDISRTSVENKRFLFWKYKRIPRKRNLAFRLNIGLVNSSFRNDYIYTNHSFVLNDINIFDDYKFKIFSGFRASSSLDYTRYMKNKNAIQFSYLWDAYATGGDLDKFEMAHHIFRLTFLFNTNNQ